MSYMYLAHEPCWRLQLTTAAAMIMGSGSNDELVSKTPSFHSIRRKYRTSSTPPHPDIQSAIECPHLRIDCNPLEMNPPTRKTLRIVCSSVEREVASRPKPPDTQTACVGVDEVGVANLRSITQLTPPALQRLAQSAIQKALVKKE